MTLPLTALSECSIHFVNVVSFKSSGFYRKRDCVTMCNYAGMCKCICSYNLVFNVLIQLLPLRTSVFVTQFSNIFWHRNEAFPKSSSQNKIVSLCNLSFAIQPILMCESVFTFVIIKIKFMPHSCCSFSTRVTLVSKLVLPVLHCVVHVAPISHSSCTYVARITFVSLVYSNR